MRDLVTSILDAFGLLLVALGLGLLVGSAADDRFAAVGAGTASLVAGVVLLAGSWFFDRQGRPPVGTLRQGGEFL